MATWPVNSIGLPSYGMSEINYRPQIKHEFEANYQQVRQKVSRTRKKFELSWNMMTNSQHAALEMFVNSSTGMQFGFQHPVTSVVHTCTIETDLQSTIVAPGFWSAKITLGEM
jgi:hypothetical protein